MFCLLYPCTCRERTVIMQCKTGTKKAPIRGEYSLRLDTFMGFNLTFSSREWSWEYIWWTVFESPLFKKKESSIKLISYSPNENNRWTCDVKAVLMSWHTSFWLTYNQSRLMGGLPIGLNSIIVVFIYLVSEIGFINIFDKTNL